MRSPRMPRGRWPSCWAADPSAFSNRANSRVGRRRGRCSGWLFGELSRGGRRRDHRVVFLLRRRLSGKYPYYWVEERLLPIRDADDDTRRLWLGSLAGEMGGAALRPNKLLTGEFRVGVSQNLVVRSGRKQRDRARNGAPARGRWQPRPILARLLAADTATPMSAGPTPSAWPSRSKATWNSLATPPHGRSVEVGRHCAQPRRHAGGVPMVARRNLMTDRFPS